MTGLVTAAAPPLSAHDFVTIGPHALSPLAQSPHQFYNVKPRFITPERMAPPPADGEEAPSVTRWLPAINPDINWINQASPSSLFDLILIRSFPRERLTSWRR
ncbi:hypothetical protein Pst134EA_031425 [Puccinia striiformis f. sp. tritici]|uniref:uncharacterized protein n=1 Tax=Puccinia striiformis f. sp. tritici TaxID=168172 RepID=UPI002007AFC8|nr:uncharacterized protein Pst134EA_031425 [Puccinia striiformis f. sp. tritici]KAH9440752.1 hypothetical protein Pst134EA_031425 [Puccinia striiformis f. sp. tritici]